MTSPRLGLVGYSTRALAEAAAALGFRVAAVDAFGDQDTVDVADCRCVADWPRAVIECARALPCNGWLLGGGMENHGRLVAQLAALAPVLGPTRAQLAALRSLKYWRELATSVSGLRVPAVFSSAGSPLSQPRLYKPFKGSGGADVADAVAVDSPRLARGYWQAFISGRVLGATTLIGDSHVRWLGATESLSAEQWPGPRPYIYRGSLGPVELELRHRAPLLALAERVGEQLGYRGYLQADLIEDTHGQLWLLELNPRWTAGMEVLRLCAKALGTSPLAAHLSAQGISLPPDERLPGISAALAGKAILYAPRELPISLAQRHLLQSFRGRQSWGQDGWWRIADVPALGAATDVTIPAGQPILTLLAGITRPGGRWGQDRQTLLDGLNVARVEIMQRVFGNAQLQDQHANGYH